MELNEIKKAVLESIDKYLPLEKTYVFLFGSRARGDFFRSSDYDIGLYNGETVSLADIALIEGELEKYTIPVDVDFIDFSQTDPDFKKISLSKIDLWNLPKTDLKLI